MKVLPYAEFTSDLPEDQIEDGPKIIQFGGKSVTAAVGEILARLGCTVSEPICDHEHGWSLEVRAGKQLLWCQVTLIDRYLLDFYQTSWFARTFGLNRPEYIDVLKRLGAELQGDSRFHDVQWFSRDQVHSGNPGSPTPIVD